MHGMMPPFDSRSSGPGSSQEVVCRGDIGGEDTGRTVWLVGWGWCCCCSWLLRGCRVRYIFLAPMGEGERVVLTNFDYKGVLGLSF